MDWTQFLQALQNIPQGVGNLLGYGQAPAQTAAMMPAQAMMPGASSLGPVAPQPSPFPAMTNLLQTQPGNVSMAPIAGGGNLYNPAVDPMVQAAQRQGQPAGLGDVWGTGLSGAGTPAIGRGADGSGGGLGGALAGLLGGASQGGGGGGVAGGGVAGPARPMGGVRMAYPTPPLPGGQQQSSHIVSLVRLLQNYL